MHFADLEVTNITRDSVNLGWQTVSREDVEGLLESMNEAEEATETFTLHVRTDKGDTSQGTAYLRPSSHPGEVVLMVYGLDGQWYRILRVGSAGVTLASGIGGSGISADSNGKAVITGQESIQ
jgi:hypothetical protein